MTTRLATITTSRAARDERGLTESLQWALILPVLMLVVLGTIQAGILLHGRNVAANAAQAAAEAESAYGAPRGAGHNAAARIARIGGLQSLDVSVQRSERRVDVTVTARIPVFFDIGQGRVDEQASAPVERVTAPGGRR